MPFDPGLDDASIEKQSQEERSPRAKSLRSWRSGRSRTRSRPSSRPASLTRIYSAGFHDDNAVYIEPADFELGNGPEQHVWTKQGVGHPSEKEEQGCKNCDNEPLEEVESNDGEPQTATGDADRTAQNDELEKAPPLSRQATRRSSKSQRERDPNMVSWNGPDDPENPKNWTMRRKWMAVLVVSSFVSRYGRISPSLTRGANCNYPSRPSSPP